MSIKLSARCKQIYVTGNKTNDTNDDKDPAKYNYSAQHPAYKLIFELGWKKFYFNLNETVNAKKKLRIIQDKDPNYDTPYQLFNYAAQFKDWNEYSILCRGMILNPSTRQIIAISFPKFFNFTEYDKYIKQHICDQFNQNSEEQKQQTDEYKSSNDNNNIFEKMDGSLGICFYCQYAKKWRFITRGSFISRQAQWATTFISTRQLTFFQQGHTYLFEIIYPANRIGVNYGNYEGLVLLAAYNNHGFEYRYEYLKLIGDQMKLDVAKCYTEQYNNIDEILAAQKVIDANQEGFVLCLSNGFRVKFKGEEYLNMVKLKTHGGKKVINCNVKKQIVENGVFIKEDILKNYDEEFHVEIESLFNEIYKDLMKRSQECVEDLLRTNNLSKGQLMKYEKGLHNNKRFVLKARTKCDQNLWKSFLVNKKSKKALWKAVNKINNEVVQQKKWRMFIGMSNKVENNKEEVKLLNEDSGNNETEEILVKKNEKKVEVKESNRMNGGEKLSKSQRRKRRRKKNKAKYNNQ